MQINVPGKYQQANVSDILKKHFINISGNPAAYYFPETRNVPELFYSVC